ncbi:MAG: MarR family transcriptional regulator [Chloroflexi bacterium]|nr:MarR family transcriptional regulator [Chloroflexota bacterium]
MSSVAARTGRPEGARRALTVDFGELQRDRLAAGIAAVDSAKFPQADPLSQELSLTLIRTFGTMNSLIEEELAADGLSRQRLHVLAFLNRAETEVRMTDVSSWLGVSKANVTNLIDALEREGLVERRASPADRRATAIAITETGRERLSHALPRHLEHVGQLLAGLNPDEKLALTHLLAKTRRALLAASGKPVRSQPAFPA